jgi:hypothetical protein
VLAKSWVGSILLENRRISDAVLLRPQASGFACCHFAQCQELLIRQLDVGQLAGYEGEDSSVEGTGFEQEKSSCS